MSGFRIGRIFGIEIQIHFSWLIIASLVMWTLASAALPADFPEIVGSARLLMASAITLLFFVSLLAHELGHSLVAMGRGIPVDRITFFIFGGMAQTSTESRTPGEEFLIAVAGPLTSFLLAALSFTLWYLGQAAGWNAIAVGSAAYIAALNLILGIFNMLPGFPMDGGRVLRAVIWKVTGSLTRATRWASRVGAGMAWLLMAYGVWMVFEGDRMGGVWLVLIGWFIRNTARASYRQHLMSRMHRMTQQIFETHSGRQSFGVGPGDWPEPGCEAGEARETGEPGGSGEPTVGRDVSHLGGRGG